MGPLAFECKRSARRLRRRECYSALVNTPAPKPVAVSIDVVDPYTVKLNLSGPQGSLLSNLSQAADGRPYMISKAMAEKAGDNYGTSPETTAGTGPMKLTEWVSGSHSVYTKTGSYYDKGADAQPLPYTCSSARPPARRTLT